MPADVENSVHSAAAASSGFTGANTAIEPLTSNLASLLDRFTSGVSNAANHTIGEFAATIETLHSELALLAHRFGGVSAPLESAGEPIEILFPSIHEGLAEEEQLQHVCWELTE